MITYSYGPGSPRWQGQDRSVTLEWMRGFQETFNLDGWYFDNADAGGFLDDYNFIKQVRTDVGDRLTAVVGIAKLHGMACPAVHVFH